MDVTNETIDKLLSLAPANIIEVDGLKYSDKLITPVKTPLTERLEFSTLEGLVDFAKSEKFPVQSFIVHITSPTNVVICDDKLDEWGRRKVYASANAIGCDFKFGLYYSVEEFIIKLSTQFDQAGSDIVKLLALVGNVREENVRQTRDDGIAQEVVVRKGAKFENAEIPRLVALAPYRTFREIEQPRSPFMPRAKDGPQFALFDAVGDLWKLQAVNEIKYYLADKFGNGVLILR